MAGTDKQQSEETNYSRPDTRADEPATPCKVKDDKEKPPPKKEITIRASLFFDGTGNNRTNVEAWKNDKASVDKWYRPGFKMESYKNDLSNIAKMERYVKQATGFMHHIVRYIEGIGTEDKVSDTVIAGQGMGMLSTGVKGKVEKGVEQLFTDIKGLVGAKETTSITKLKLDAFGFSRGAAAARYFFYNAFIDEEENIMTRLQKEGYSVSGFQAGFAGLFDTVASFGIVHSNDTDDLHLDSVAAVSKVVHLVAYDEHRKNFALTDIRSKHGGLEIELPGVHSDVGGGYADDYEEDNIQILDLDVLWLRDVHKIRFEEERARLIREGWYKPEKGEIKEVNFWNELRVSRQHISNQYSRIPMFVMTHHATNAQILFNNSLMQGQDPIPADLQSMKNWIGIDGKGGWKSHLNDIEFRENRHKYFHYSAFFGSTAGANAPRFVKDEANPGKFVRKREIFPG
ncbi:MAG: DUF2235 domain-containing protein [Bacteroidetes bacterium]|nr:DUF2235 domain-containing protein [Bacteroidota bacterium]